MLIKKYGAILLFLVLEWVFVIITDVTVGLPWNNFVINWSFTLFTGIERVIAVILVLLIVIPDLKRYLFPKQSNSGSRSSSGSRSNFIDHRGNKEN